MREQALSAARGLGLGTVPCFARPDTRGRVSPHERNWFVTCLDSRNGTGPKSVTVRKKDARRSGMKLGEIPTSRKICKKWGTQIQAPPALSLHAAHADDPHGRAT